MLYLSLSRSAYFSQLAIKQDPLLAEAYSNSNVVSVSLGLPTSVSWPSSRTRCWPRPTLTLMLYLSLSRSAYFSQLAIKQDPLLAEAYSNSNVVSVSLGLPTSASWPSSRTHCWPRPTLTLMLYLSL